MASTEINVQITQVPRVWVVTPGRIRNRWVSGEGSIAVWEVESIHATEFDAEYRAAQLGGWFGAVPWNLGKGPVDEG